MLQLLSLLQTHRYWSGTELADRLEVSDRTLRRDVDRLRELGYPVRAVRGVAGGYQLQAGAAMPPLLLDDEEAVAIVVGLRAAAGGMVDGIEEISVRALGKVVQVMPPRLRRRVDALQAYTVPAVLAGAGPTVDAGVLATIAQACRDDERLRFGYRPRDGEPMQRHVEPHRLVSVGRRWYVVAWDLTRHDWRSFRVDRMSGATTSGVRFRPRDLPGGDAAEFVTSSLRNIPQRHHVSVRVHTSADDVRRRVGRWGEVEVVDEEECRLTMEVDDLGWPMLVLAGVGAEFTVEGPPDLVDAVRSVGALFTRAAAQAPVAAGPRPG
jgi:predicted DNA-binding transcriptional regulator YafY